MAAKSRRCSPLPLALQVQHLPLRSRCRVGRPSHKQGPGGMKGKPSSWIWTILPSRTHGGSSFLVSEGNRTISTTSQIHRLSGTFIRLGDKLILNKTSDVYQQGGYGDEDKEESELNEITLLPKDAIQVWGKTYFLKQQ